jgi:hypothetical protein
MPMYTAGLVVHVLTKNSNAVHLYDLPHFHVIKGSVQE